MKAPYTERYVRCCERTAVSHRLLLDFAVKVAEVYVGDGEVGEAICSQKECNRTSNNAMHSGESKKRTAIILITKNNFAIM